MITDHVFRIYPNGIEGRGDVCAYMNCRRPRAEHERAVTGVHGPRRQGR